MARRAERLTLFAEPAAILARAAAPGGGEMILRRLGDGYEIRIDGRELMSSRGHGSEAALARRAAAALRERPSPRVLVGGLGLGYTLRAALDAFPAAARFVVAELLPAIVAWNRGPLAPLAGRPLDDPRVALHVGDVAALLGGDAAFDAILLDVDNGPEAVTVATNRQLYQPEGLALLAAALSPGGVLAIWSADPAPSFLTRLADAGLVARAELAPARGETGGPEHTIFLAAKRD